MAKPRRQRALTAQGAVSRERILDAAVELIAERGYSATSVDALFKLNDVELYDVERDPLERNNLALERDKHRELLGAMNAKLNALIEREVGEDVGQMLPGGVDGGWVVTDAVYDV